MLNELSHDDPWLLNGMLNSYIILPFCLGAAVINSTEVLNADEWYTIRVERNLQDGSLSVNGGVAVKGKRLKHCSHHCYTLTGGFS